MKKTLLILLLSSYFISCSNQFKNEIQEIEKLIASLDSSKTVLHSIDTGLIYKRVKIIERNITYIIENSDSATREQAYIIDDYSLNKKYYNKLTGKLPPLYDELETLPRQLENLKTDLSNNLIEKESAAVFLDNEKIAAKSVIKNVIFVEDRLHSLNDSYNTSSEKILNLIQTIDSKRENSVES